jgi:hypothetical protein
VLQSLHSGDGFWHLAPDAPLYYVPAARAVGEGLHVVGPDTPSPGYVRTLAIWMAAVGVSPASPLLLNLLVYAFSCWLLVRLSWRSRHRVPVEAVAPAVVGLTFSPALLFCSTQILKDVFFVSLVVAGAVGIRTLLETPRVSRVSRPPTVPLIAGGLAATIAVYLMAGVRPYFALMFWTALAGASVLAVLLSVRASFTRSVIASTALVAMTWLAFAVGGGPQGERYELLARHAAARAVQRATGIAMPPQEPRTAQSAEARAPASPGVLQTVDSVRRDFVSTGGATNLVKKPASTEVSADDDRPTGPSRLAAMATGIAVIFVPISILRALDIVHFEGGRGLLYLTDLDTVFFGLTALGVVAVLVRHRRSLHALVPFGAFLAGLGLIAVVLIGYVVTNYGTLFRLRLIAFTTIWLAPLAVSLFRGAATPDGVANPPSVGA